MSGFQWIILAAALGGFVYGFYCQTMARRHISKKKLVRLEDPSILATGPMPPKQILSEEGLKYHRGFMIGMGLFAVGIITLIITMELSGG